MDSKRRQLIAGISLAGAGVLLNACRTSPSGSGSATNKSDEPAPGEAAPVEVTAAEDLMREHGILRRALLVYRESAIRLRQDAASVPPDVLEKAANLFRVFGEDYHEQKLEEVYIFPIVKQSPMMAALAGYVDVLVAQHTRGREITDYLLSITKADRIPSNSVEPVAKALESFVRMYEHHAAIEDTVVFPAWKTAIGQAELDELGGKFEEIEHQQFGDDGFEAALKRMEEIETSLGLSNLDMFTAPPPPK